MLLRYSVMLGVIFSLDAGPIWPAARLDGLDVLSERTGMAFEEVLVEKQILQ